MKHHSVVFLCVANSARSQMAEGLARHLLGDEVVIQSAGSEPSQVNPYAVRAMAEIGINIGDHHSKSVDSLDRRHIDLVITLCAEQVCPLSLSDVKTLNWPLADPDRRHESLSDDQRLQNFRVARDAIHARLQGWFDV